ncbi:MAG: hypothetical protein K9G49_09260 [Taibaiella sp.]|nr:hypothetical protein [Taibaiella sp.]
MTLAAVKEKLHSYIDHADDKKLKAIYTLLQNDMETTDLIDEKMMKELDKRWENYSTGKSKTYTLEESMKEIKKHRNGRKSNAA